MRVKLVKESLIESKVHNHVDKAEQDWIYLIHHMHSPSKSSEMEEVHHCTMFDKKNEKGDQYKQKHVKEGKIFQHVLEIENLEEAPEIIYDHLNNGFKVVIREIGKKKYAVISGPIKIKDIKWSDQDR